MANTEDRIDSLARKMDKIVDTYSRHFVQYDRKVAKFIESELKGYKQSDGRLDNDFDYTDSLRRLDEFTINLIVNKEVLAYINSGIKDFDELRKANIQLHNEINGAGLTRDFRDYTLNFQAQQILDDFTSESAIRHWFISPFKAALATAVETGAGVETVKRFLAAWEEQGKQSGILSGVNSIPNFSQYSGQLARDAVFKTANAISGSVREVLGLEYFIYSGNTSKDSREFCKHVVGLNRKVKFEEVPALGKTYPNGLIKPFTIDTFTRNAGGYNCVHLVFPVRE